VHLQVIGPRDRAVDLVRNLEHSKRFLIPRIVGENAESTDHPGQRLEPVSASDRVGFDLLAQYNPASAEERSMTRNATGKATRKAPEAEGSPRSAPRSALPVPLRGVGRRRPPYTGQGQSATPGTVNQGAKTPPSPLHSTPGGPQ
jgi:type IV pilus assembly protein PilN